MRGLAKCYGELGAVRDVNREVRAEVFARLGPNVAGTTTVIEILDTATHQRPLYGDS